MSHVAHDRIADDAILAIGRGSLESAHKIACDGQVLGDSAEAIFVSNVQLLVQIGAIAEWLDLGEHRIDWIDGVSIGRARLVRRRGPTPLTLTAVHSSPLR